MGKPTSFLPAILLTAAFSLPLSAGATLTQRSFVETAQAAEEVAVVEVTDVEMVWAKSLFARYGISLPVQGPDKLLSIVRARTLPMPTVVDGEPVETSALIQLSPLANDQKEVRFALLGGVKGEFGQYVSGAGHVVIGRKYVVLLGKAGPGGIRKVQGNGVGLLELDGNLVRPVLVNGRIFPEDGLRENIVLEALFEALGNVGADLIRPSTRFKDVMVPNKKRFLP